MTLELRWIAGVSVSALHTAWAMTTGRKLVDAILAEQLAAPVAALLAATGIAGERQRQLLEQLVALSGGIENNSQLAEVALTKTIGRGQWSPNAVHALAGAIADIENVLLRSKSGLVDELAVRGEPLRQQWEARGPGVLHIAAQRTDSSLLVSSADVFLVLPVLGGGGAAHWQYNSVRIEAVLANPLAELPEILRLAWLLAQLQLDLPMYTETLSPVAWLRAAPLIMIPPILSAAEEVELARYDAATLALGIEHWTGVTSEEAKTVAATVDAWWQTYQAARPGFPVALAALAEMLD